MDQNNENKRSQRTARPAGAASNQSRPAGTARPAGAASNQSRPAGTARPAGAASNQSRPAGTARPAGAASNQSRPAGTARPAGAASNQSRPAGTARPAGAASNQSRPAGTARPAGAASNQSRPAGSPRSAKAASNQSRPAGTANRQAGSRRQTKPASGHNGNNSGNTNPPKKKRMGTGARIAIFALEILVIVGLIYAVRFVGKATGKDTGVQKYNLDEEEIKVNQEVVQNETMKGYRTIALFGVDTTTKTTAESLLKGNRTDCIIIASINQDTGEVKLVSVYRDTYLNRSNDEYNKANSAYAKGGPEMAINMLNTNLDLNITDYITVGFGGLIQAIDGLGGVDIDLREDEIRHLNSYQISISGKKTGELNAAGEPVYAATPGKDYIPVEHSGLQTLNGLQATAYCRIRYVGDDFMRAQRQRNVVNLMVEKAKVTPLTTLTSVATDVFPYISTSLGLEEIIELLGSISKYTIVDNEGFPYEDYRGTGTLGSVGSCVLPLDLETNVIWLHEFLYGDTDYVPSATVKENSATTANKISNLRK